MRVVHVIEAMHQGGAEAMVVEHVRHAGAGVASTVVALNRGGPALEAAARAGAEVLCFEKGGRRGEAVARLAGLLRAREASVVNGHNPTGALYATLAALRAGLPAAFPVFRTEHSVHSRGRHSRVYPLLEALITLRTTRIVSVCRAVEDSHARRLPWARSRFTVIENGIGEAPPPRAPEATRAALGIDRDRRIVLAIGSLTPHKDHEMLLRAFARIASARPDVVLLIAGEGRLKDVLARRTGALGLGDRVRWLGPRNDADDLLAAASVFVSASGREGLPITVLEAMRGGRPVVATRAGGTAEAVEDGRTGSLVPIGDDAGLAAALVALLDDPARAEAFGVEGRRRWQERFTAARMVARTEALYREALAVGSARRAASRIGAANGG